MNAFKLDLLTSPGGKSGSEDIHCESAQSGTSMPGENVTNLGFFEFVPMTNRPQLPFFASGRHATSETLLFLVDAMVKGAYAAQS